MQYPYYVVHQHTFQTLLQDLKEALQTYWPNYTIGYSYKTNSLPWVVRFCKDHGCFAEVVSDDEYQLAKHYGIPDDNMIYNGPVKGKESFLSVIKNQGVVNIDSQREIRWLSELDGSHQTGIRVNFDLEKYAVGQSQCGDEGGRFGFCYENGELKKAIDRIREQGDQVVGLHLHTSSKARGVEVYQAIASMACRIADEYDLKLKYVDIGGGFFGGLSNKPQFRDYAREVADILRNRFSPEQTQLIVEPGMALIGASVSYVTSVIDVKDTSYNRFVILDGTRMDIDPLMTKSKYFYSLEKSEISSVCSKQVLCGSTCMEHDRLMTLTDEQELQVGDRIVFDKVGAYTMCLSPLFIHYFPAVYLENDGEMKLIREKWTAEQYCQGCEDQ